MLTTSLLEDVNELRRSFDQFFETFGNGPRRQAQRGTEWAFIPPVETGWTDDNLNVRVIVPGVTEGDITVTVQGNQFYIQGERKAPMNFGKEGYVWSQMPYGKFERVLDLPAGLDLDRLEAQLHDGVLDIRIPVASAMKPKQIPISAGKSETEQRKQEIAA